MITRSLKFCFFVLYYLNMFTINLKMRNISFGQILVLVFLGFLLFSDVKKVKKYILNFFEKLKLINVKVKNRKKGN